MCMEDVRLGRKTSSQITAVTIGVASAQLLAADPTRYALVLTPPAAGRVTIMKGPTATLDGGINLYALGPPLVLNVQDHGELVTAPLAAIADAAARIVGIAFSQLTEK